MLAALVVIMAAQGPAKKTDACALLANEDVKRVLGAEIKERQPATQDARGLLLFQCYIATGTPRSVSIAMAGETKSGTRTISPRDFWREQFHKSGRRNARKQAREPRATKRGRDEEIETEARPIGGLGDEAFWSGTRVAGALYVLRGPTFLRVSVGGIKDEPERIEKSRQLALAALARIPK